MRTKHKTLSVLLGLATLLYSCKKKEIEQTPLASLAIINAVPESPAVKLGANRNTVAYSRYGQFGLLTGSIALNVYPEDNSATYFNQTLDIYQGDIYTLFLAGTAPIADPILVKESIPIYTDSLAGIRFINLSPGNIPISINQQGNAAGSEVTGLAYKAMTTFKAYSAKNKAAETQRVFEFRNAGAGDLLATYTFSGTGADVIPRFRNVTLVFRGIINGTPATGITRCNHY